MDVSRISHLQTCCSQLLTIAGLLEMHRQCWKLTDNLTMLGVDTGFMNYLTLSITSRWKLGVHASSTGSTSADGKSTSTGFSACTRHNAALVELQEAASCKPLIAVSCTDNACIAG